MGTRPKRTPTDVRAALSLHGLPRWWIAMTLYALHKLPSKAAGLDGAEIFAGKHQLSSGLMKHNGLVATFELEDGPEQNILSIDGVILVLQYILCIKVGGLLWMGTPCCSWVMLSRSSTGRSALRPGGPKRFPTDFVKRHNSIAEICALLARTAYSCSVYFVFEQPQSSLLYTYPPMQEMLRYCQAVSCHLWMGAFGGESAKPLMLKGTAPWLQSTFPAVCHALWHGRAKSSNSKLQLANMKINASGKRQFNGNPKALKASSAYTMSFGEAVGMAQKGHDASYIISHVRKINSEGEPVAKKRRIFGIRDA